jgi:antitoxin (DNA-binding transcriptional repressor) of toxin-antitoxin stability system
MNTITLADAKAHLSELVDRVEPAIRSTSPVEDFSPRTFG